jgi:hypothetical protein
MRFVETPEDFETWCERQGYTKDDLATILGVTRQTLYNWTHKRSFEVRSSHSEEITRDIEAQKKAYAKIPRMLSFALLAIETMAPENVFGGRRLRKRPKNV